ncbi:MAG TPA: hypothetical protein VNR65_08265, partial [Geobacterales bacterium]|nr:hypothetical protein [Geobacterales bacterium]
MAIKIKLPDGRASARPASGRNSRDGRGRPLRTQHFSIADPLVKLLASGFLIAGVLFMVVFTYFYVKYENIVDRRMSGPIFSNAARIYARPHTVW